VSRMMLDPKSSMESIARPTSAVVADDLRQRILHGMLSDGERLLQDAIATRFGVSQMIVREAFQQLVTEGFLRSEPRRGVSVAPLILDETREVTQLRVILEAQALEWAIPEMTEVDFATAGRILAKLDRATAADQIIALNSQFHETLYAPSKRERTLLLIRSLRLNFERYLRFLWEDAPHLTKSQSEHKRILALCQAQDVSGATSLLKQHINTTGMMLVKRLRSRTAHSDQKHQGKGSR
jgi:DNA-binding GntR family transcriptional regulator